MTDKEIIIECSHINLTDWGTYSCKLYDPHLSSEKALVQYGTCEANTNCAYKQLQRTHQQYNQVVEQNKNLQQELQNTKQECEELKEQVKLTRKYLADSINEYNRATRYKQTLEKIEEECEHYTNAPLNFEAIYAKSSMDEIMDILNEVKDE